MTTARPLLFSAFLLNSVSHIMHGLWVDPNARNTQFNRLGHWTNLARELEEWGYDFLFFADGVGLTATWQGSHEYVVTRGLQFPRNDPSVLISALAAATRNLGLVYTSSVLQLHPFEFARKASSLDHYTDGRLGWNIVTGTSTNGFRNFGFEDAVEHDARYEWAAEYLDVVFKLWEGSWDDGALIQDRETGIHADPARIHKIHHRGPRYTVEGPHLVSPSPQRTPFLFQAGSSVVGQRFAAANAEGTFLLSPSPQVAGVVVKETRAALAEAGRDPNDITFIQGLSFVVAPTRSEAEDKARHLLRNRTLQSITYHVLGIAMGFDGGHLPLDTPISELPTVPGSRGHLRSLAVDSQLSNPTLRDLVEMVDGRNRLVGTPEEIADKLEEWRAAGIGGINVIPTTLPDGFRDVAELLFPELEKRGLFTTDKSGTLRQKITGRGDLLPASHPASRFRGAFSGNSLARTDDGGAGTAAT